MAGHLVSKKRVVKHGEVYTREREVNAMLDLVRQETERIDSRFLEPACGTGNFLIEILRRKLDQVEKRYKRSQTEYEKYAFVAVSSLYGIDILPDNIETCRNRLFYLLDEGYASLYQKKTKAAFRGVIRFVLEKNIIRGDALTLKTVGNRSKPIVFSEWSIVRGSQVKRRDFAFHELLPEDVGDSLFSQARPKSDEGKPVFIPSPVKEYPLCYFMRITDVD
jgi:SAM-dependent methyltransferase